MKNHLLIALVAALSAQAQDVKPDPVMRLPTPGQNEAVLVPVKTLTGESFDRLVKLLAVFHENYSADSQLRTILIYAPREKVAEMKRVIEELDRPGSDAALGRNIDMTLTLLRCSVKSPTGGASLPPDVEAVAKQLRAATQYKGIEVLDIVPLRLQEGRISNETLRLPGLPAPGAFSVATLFIQPDAVGRKNQGRYVRFGRLSFSLRVPFADRSGAGFSYQDVKLETSGDFLEGQKTVIGKVSGVAEDEAIFVVVALKVLD